MKVEVGNWREIEKGAEVGKEGKITVWCGRVIFLSPSTLHKHRKGSVTYTENINLFLVAILERITVFVTLQQ